MRSLHLFAALTLAASSLSPFAARADEANTALTASIIALGRGDVPGAHGHLDTAEAKASDGLMLAKIHRQRGIVYEVEAKRVEALLSFLRGLYFDASLKLPEREHKGEVQRIFDCAKALAEAGIKEAAVKARYQKDLERADWKCPLGPEATAALPPAPKPEPKPEPKVEPRPEPKPEPKAEPKPPSVTPPPPPAPPLTATTPPPSEHESKRSLFSRPLFWIVVGAVVVGGAVTTAVLLGSGTEEPYGGNTGVSISLSGGDE